MGNLKGVLPIETIESYLRPYAEPYFEPLTPFITDLVGNTSIIDLPGEMISIVQSAAGFVSDKEKENVVQETKALIWALVDISFLLEILKNCDKLIPKFSETKKQR